MALGVTHHVRLSYQWWTHLWCHIMKPCYWNHVLNWIPYSRIRMLKICAVIGFTLFYSCYDNDDLPTEPCGSEPFVISSLTQTLYINHVHIWLTIPTLSYLIDDASAHYCGCLFVMGLLSYLAGRCVRTPCITDNPRGLCQPDNSSRFTRVCSLR